MSSAKFSNLVDRYNSAIFRYPYLFWIAGIYFPLFYIFPIVNFGKIIQSSKSISRINYLIVFVLIVLFLAILASVFYPFFNLFRFIAAWHNYYALILFFVGLVIIRDCNIRYLLRKNSEEVFKVVTSISILTFLGTLFLNTSIRFPNIFYPFLGMDSWSMVNFSSMGYFLGISYPRIRIMALYPNSAAILMLLFFSVMIAFKYSEFSAKRVLIYSLLNLLSMAFTGSRIAIIISLLLIIPLLYFKIRSTFKRFLFISIVLLVFSFLVVGFNTIDIILEARSGSNRGRLELYKESITMMWNINPILGIGIKPIIVGNFGAPIGSHSTHLGLLVRGGVLVGLSFLLFNIYFLFRVILSLTMKKNEAIEKRIINLILINALFLIFLVEDMDAFGPNAFYFGLLIGIYQIGTKYHSDRKILLKLK